MTALHGATASVARAANPTSSMVIRRTEFDSGLRVVTERMPGVRSATIGIWVSTGSRNENEAQAGSSHFLEHLLFKGTPTRTAQDIAEAFDAIGGDLNAFTSKETTCYYARVKDTDVALAIEHLTDMLLNSQIRSADFEAERQVVLEEINIRDDTPDDLVGDLLNEVVWPEHPLGRPVLGTKERIANVSRATVMRYYKSRYAPQNFVVAIAGNVDHEQAVKLVRKHIPAGKIKRASEPTPMVDGGKPPVASGKNLIVHKKTEQAHLCFGTDGLSRTDPDRFAMGVVNTVLGGGMSSRMFQEIREKRGLAYSVYTYHQQYAETGFFGVYAGTTPSKAREVLALARGQLEDVAANGVTDAELQRAKGSMKGSLVLSLEDSSSRMSRLGKSEIGGITPMTISQAVRHIDKVSPDDARRVAAKVAGGRWSLTVLGPYKKSDFDDVLDTP